MHTRSETSAKTHESMADSARYSGRGALWAERVGISSASLAHKPLASQGHWHGGDKGRARTPWCLTGFRSGVEGSGSCESEGSFSTGTGGGEKRRTVARERQTSLSAPLASSERSSRSEVGFSRPHIDKFGQRNGAGGRRFAAHREEGSRSTRMHMKRNCLFFFAGEKGA